MSTRHPGSGCQRRGYPPQVVGFCLATLLTAVKAVFLPARLTRERRGNKPAVVSDIQETAWAIDWMLDVDGYALSLGDVCEVLEMDADKISAWARRVSEQRDKSKRNIAAKYHRMRPMRSGQHSTYRNGKSTSYAITGMNKVVAPRLITALRYGKIEVERMVV